MVTIVVKFTDKTIFTQDLSEEDSVVTKVEDAQNKFYLDIFIGGQLALLSPMENVEYYFIKKRQKEESLHEIHGDTTVKHYDFFNRKK